MVERPRVGDDALLEAIRARDCRPVRYWSPSGWAEQLGRDDLARWLAQVTPVE